MHSSPAAGTAAVETSFTSRFPPFSDTRPGVDIYKNLPSKTLQLLHYALSSECKFTHVLKTDDDVYLRPQVGAISRRAMYMWWKQQN